MDFPCEKQKQKETKTVYFSFFEVDLKVIRGNILVLIVYIARIHDYYMLKKDEVSLNQATFHINQ